MYVVFTLSVEQLSYFQNSFRMVLYGLTFVIGTTEGIFYYDIFSISDKYAIVIPKVRYCTAIFFFVNIDIIIFDIVEHVFLLPIVYRAHEMKDII